MFVVAGLGGHTSKQIPSGRYQISQVKELPGPSFSVAQMPKGGSGDLFCPLSMDSVLLDEFCFQAETSILDLSVLDQPHQRALIKKVDAGDPP